MSTLKLIVFIVIGVTIMCTSIQENHGMQAPKIMLGIDVLVQEKTDLIAGKRVGLITNATGMTSDLKSTIDALNEIPAVKLTALFGPEHGVRGDIAR